MDATKIDNCPVCNFPWKGPDIYEYFKSLKEQGHPSFVDREDWELEGAASMYGWTKEKPTYFSEVIGLELSGRYDGVMYWKCPQCNGLWDRFTGNKLSAEDAEAVLTLFEGPKTNETA